MLSGYDQAVDERSLFLTGGTGFFGRSLLRYLLLLEKTGENPFGRVTVLSRSPSAFLAKYPEFSGLPWLGFVGGDVLSNPATFPAHEQYSHVLHAAADSTFGPLMAPIDRYDQITRGTRNVLDFAVRIGAKRFLLTSSGGVYGMPPPSIEKIPENFHGVPDPMVSDNVYSIAKRTAEHLCALYGKQYGLTVVVARCFAFVGPDLPLDAHFAIGNFIQDAMTGSEILVNGNGTPIRSYLYQDDLAEWLLVLLGKGAPSSAYNVGSDVGITISELAHLVRDLLAPGKPVRLRGSAISDSAIRNRYLPDTSRARKELGLDIRVPLPDAIQLTAQTLGDRNAPSAYSRLV